MKKIVLVTPPEARFGFTLAGVTQLVAAVEEAEVVVLRSLEDPQCGVLILDERLLAGMGEERFAALGKRWSGVLALLPAPEAGERDVEDYAQRLIRRVIGYQVRVGA